MWGLCPLSQPALYPLRKSSPASRDGRRKPTASAVGNQKNESLPLCRRPARNESAAADERRAQDKPRSLVAFFRSVFIRVNPWLPFSGYWLLATAFAPF